MADVDVDPAVRIVVTPSQSSYFAGEPFSVTITFTNTRSPEPGRSRATSNSHTHRRNAHSISSAPIARPPTSPGTPRTPRTAMPIPPRQSRDDKPGRKGLIGRTSTSPVFPAPATGSLPALVELRRKKMLAKSLPHDLRHSHPTLPSPQTSPPPYRDAPTLSPSRQSHPHARKQSILDGTQLQLQELMTSPISPSSSTPYTPSASSSTFSLALDPIAESVVYPYPPTPADPSSPAVGHPLPIPTPMSAPPRAYPPRRDHAHAQTSLGHGHPPPMPIPSRTAHSTTFAAPHTELLLYAYASLAGRAVLAPLAGSGTAALGALRATLLRPARGGGSLSLQAAGAPPPRHRRSSSFSAGLRALGAGIGIWGRNASGAALILEMRVGRGSRGAGADARGRTGDACGGSEPGARRVAELCTRTRCLLPANLPPTFKGRTLRFSYELVVGACRGAGSSSSLARHEGPDPRSGRPARPYDLLWPVARRIGTPASTPVGPPPPALQADPRPSVEEHRAPAAPAHPPKAQQAGSVAELERYAARLLAATASPSASTAGFPWGTGDEGVGGAGGGGLSGCREAVEVLTRNLKKVSYDITKDGVTVAVLTFPKSAFRLGETVNGVVEVNWREGRGRVLQLTALLEAHESLPAALAIPPSTAATERYLRRVHAEHHARFVLGTRRLGFALDIPSDGSPAFGIAAADGSAGGLEWRVRLCLLVGVARAESDAGTEGVRAKGLVRDADDADASGGRGAWGSAWRAPARLGFLERIPPPPPTPVSPPPAERVPASAGWGAFLAASFLGEREYHDGDDFDEEEGPEGRAAEEEGYDGVKSDLAGGVGVGVRYGGREDGWSEVKAEMVECVVPVRVWAGNTAFRAGDVVFDV
ncbi:Rgp1-domain-containing protein [Mycena vulgaris]|nr:Rgp1-domain-containing protein [Mycena vulgaris]